MKTMKQPWGKLRRTWSDDEDYDDWRRHDDEEAEQLVELIKAGKLGASRLGGPAPVGRDDEGAYLFPDQRAVSQEEIARVYWAAEVRRRYPEWQPPPPVSLGPEFDFADVPVVEPRWTPPPPRRSAARQIWEQRHQHPPPRATTVAPTRPITKPSRIALDQIAEVRQLLREGYSVSEINRQLRIERGDIGRVNRDELPVLPEEAD